MSEAKEDLSRTEADLDDRAETTSGLSGVSGAELDRKVEAVLDRTGLPKTGGSDGRWAKGSRWR